MRERTGLSMAFAFLSLGSVHLAPVDGGEAVALSEIGGRAHVVMFWRSDCAPCLIELHELRDLQRAAGDGALVSVALEPQAQAEATLHRLGLSSRDAFVAQEDAQTVLENVSRGGRRLPYAIALDRHGHICARHVGLLGTERARAWMRQCSR